MSKTMTRREALKAIGLAIGTATVGLSGVSGLTSCPQKAISFKPSDQWLLGPERNPDARYRNPNVSLNDIINSNRQ